MWLIARIAAIFLVISSTAWADCVYWYNGATGEIEDSVEIRDRSVVIDPNRQIPGIPNLRTLRITQRVRPARDKILRVQGGQLVEVANPEYVQRQGRVNALRGRLRALGLTNDDLREMGLR